MLKGISRSGLVRPSAPSAPRSAAPRKMKSGAYLKPNRRRLEKSPRTKRAEIKPPTAIPGVIVGPGIVTPPEQPCGGSCLAVDEWSGGFAPVGSCTINPPGGCDCSHIVPADHGFDPDHSHVESMCITY